jgi:hypothetical protein
MLATSKWIRVLGIGCCVCSAIIVTLTLFPSLSYAQVTCGTCSQCCCQTSSGACHSTTDCKNGACNGGDGCQCFAEGEGVGCESP